MYKRKTFDEYQILQYTGSRYGWEVISVYNNWKNTREDLKAYRENQPEYPVKLIKKRVKL